MGDIAALKGKIEAPSFLEIGLGFAGLC